MNKFTDLPLYRSTKVVGALKIHEVTQDPHSRAVTLTFVTGEEAPGYLPRAYTMEQMANKPNPLPGWYLVEYEPTPSQPEGYFSFSPAESFEMNHLLMQVDHTTGFHIEPPAQFDFCQALWKLKAGLLLAREGWNGKGMFIFLVAGSQFAVNRAPLLGIFPEGTQINYRPHVDMKTVDGQVVPWICSQSDMLATDWMLVTLEPVA